MPKTLNLASWRVEPYTIDSITVLRGPTSVLYGQGDPGAIVDVQSKLANGDRIREIEVQVGNYARKQLAFDIGDTANSDGTLSYRLIGVGRDGNSDRPQQGRPHRLRPVAAMAAQRGDVADAVGHLPGRPQRHRQQLPAGPGHGAAQSQRPHLARCVHRRAGLQLLPQKQWSLGYAFEHKPDSTWTLRQNVRLMHSQLNNRSVWGGGLDASDPPWPRSAAMPASSSSTTAASTSTIRPRPNSAQAGCSIRCWPAWNQPPVHHRQRNAGAGAVAEPVQPAYSGIDHSLFYGPNAFPAPTPTPP